MTLKKFSRFSRFSTPSNHYKLLTLFFKKRKNLKQQVKKAIEIKKQCDNSML